jgi:alpha,alpha-trehalose phosphorylase
MSYYDIASLPEHVYPGDEWRFVEKGFDSRFLPQTETFFSTSNGYLGLRGTFEEGAPVCQSGTFINGFYEAWPIVYAEEAYGFAKTGQTLVNVTDSKLIKLYVDDEPFYLPTANLLHCERALDMRAGTLDRDVLWETPYGKRVRITSQRLVSFEHRHLAAIAYEVTVLNAAAPVVLSSEMLYAYTEVPTRWDPRLMRGFIGRALFPRRHYARDLRIVLSPEDAGKVVFLIDAKPGTAMRLVKYMTYHSSRRSPAEELCERAERSLDRAVSHGFTALLAGQRQHVAAFWRRSDVQIASHPVSVQTSAPTGVQIQQAIRFSLFHILQASARAEGAGIPAKGLTGLGYEGHYFWDTEIYLIPFLTYTAPRVARNLLQFRFGFLAKARERARTLHHKGALFPWRTINGEEASAYYAAGTAQYHINADIVYAIRKYVKDTGEREFLDEKGVEVLGLLLRAPGRTFLHSWRHGAGRVYHRREQQPLHEPHGTGKPPVRCRDARAATRREAGALRRTCGRDGVAGCRDGALARYCGQDVSALRYEAGGASAGRRVLGQETVGLRGDIVGQVSAAVPLSPTGHLPPPGDQAG